MGDPQEGPSRLVAYQAEITLPATLERIWAVEGRIRQLGGRLERLTTPRRAEVTIVMLYLPPQIYPAQLFAGLPFFPVQMGPSGYP